MSGIDEPFLKRDIMSVNEIVGQPDETHCIAKFYCDWAANNPKSFIETCLGYPIEERGGRRGLVQILDDYQMTIELDDENVWIQWDIACSMIYVAVKRNLHGRVDPWKSHCFSISIDQHAAIREAVKKAATENDWIRANETS